MKPATVQKMICANGLVGAGLMTGLFVLAGILAFFG